MVQRRFSKQRQIIYDMIMNNPVHPTADYIYNTLKGEYPDLSLGTVYRNLNVLTEMGMSEEGAAFCAEFFVGANVIYILSNFYKTGKVDFETVELSFKLMEGGLRNEHF